MTIVGYFMFVVGACVAAVESRGLGEFCFSWQVLECIRRLLLTGLLVFVPDTSGQVVYGCIFAFIRCGFRKKPTQWLVVK